MPLKLADINDPNSTNIVNRWADDKEAALNQHTTQIAQLQKQIDQLTQKKA